MRSKIGLHSPSWTGVRSLLGERGRKEREEGPLSSQVESGTATPSSVEFSSPSVTSASTGDKLVGDKAKTGKRSKSKEPKSFKSNL